MPNDHQATATELAVRLVDVAEDRARQLLEEDGLHHGARFNPFYSPFSGPQEERRVHSLALLQACTEMVADLHRTADDAAGRALANGASYAEIGAARGISRQAARQRHQKELAEQKARREAFEARRAERRDDFYGDEEGERWNRWPPRPWKFRAPTGTRTVRLVGGPADSQTIRVPVGDDAFPYIDHTNVFGRLHARHARYTPSKADSDEYRFTGEYLVRWS